MYHQARDSVMLLGTARIAWVPARAGSQLHAANKCGGNVTGGGGDHCGTSPQAAVAMTKHNFRERQTARS